MKTIVIFAMVLFLGACGQNNRAANQVLPVFAKEPGGRALTPDEWEKWRAARAADPAYQEAVKRMQATPRYKEAAKGMDVR